MTLEAFTALALFAVVSSITPGPNNLMLMASGANFGLLRTMPHMLGVALGFVLMVILVGVGIVRIFEIWPITRTILNIACGLYLLYLAWKIATAAPASPDAPETTGTPMTFLQAAAFQWVNPKAWAMAVSATTVYLPRADLTGILLVGVIFGAINLPSVGVWAGLGVALRTFLSSPTRLRIFNWIMAILLVGSLWPIVA